MAERGLFLGINRYKDSRNRELRGARRDAVAMEALFADSFPFTPEQRTGLFEPHPSAATATSLAGVSTHPHRESSSGSTASTERYVRHRAPRAVRQGATERQGGRDTSSHADSMLAMTRFCTAEMLEPDDPIA
jgi:hypothetical protein